jgi:hypothetical protein
LRAERLTAVIVRQLTGNPADPYVILDYGDPSARRAHHTERRPQPSDRLRTALIRAERELCKLEIICEHIEISEIGADRIAWALNTLRGYLEMERPSLHLAGVVP